MINCPLCFDSNASEKSQIGDTHEITCPKCGPYKLTGTANVVAIGDSVFSDEDRKWLPYAIRRISERGQIPDLDSNDLKAIKQNLQRPSAHEAADNLIRQLGDPSREIGKFVDVLSDPALPFKVGVVSGGAGLRYLVDELEKKGLVNCDRKTLEKTTQRLKVDLSFDGWERFEQLSQGAHSGRSAFMAMQFGDSELETVVNDYFRPAVRATGYELRVLNDPRHQKAGLIDDELRVAIKQARFLIADLTHDNSGAYWEAGLAEGLGKPVIYTCKKKVFDDRKTGTHFDTNHHLHILWDPSDLDNAVSKLSACIRATVPEAKQ